MTYNTWRLAAAEATSTLALYDVAATGMRLLDLLRDTELVMLAALLRLDAGGLVGRLMHLYLKLTDPEDWQTAVTETGGAQPSIGPTPLRDS